MQENIHTAREYFKIEYQNKPTKYWYHQYDSMYTSPDGLTLRHFDDILSKYSFDEK